MTTIGSVGSSYAYPEGVKRWGNGLVIPTAELKNSDRAAWAQAVAETSDGRFTADDVLKHEDESDRVTMQQAINDEKFLRGEGTYIGSSRGNKTFWDPAGNAKAIEQARQARSKPYAHMSGAVAIEALNVDSAVKAQGKVTGGDLKNLSYYGDYLRNEVAAASSVKSDVTFTGRWGKDRVTNDVNEYVGWLFQAAQAKSQVTTDAQQTD